jgi:hypothetical protein
VTYVLTLWICMNSNPFCTQDQDPSGPPTYYSAKSYLACEAINARNIDHWGATFHPRDPKETLPRHTCAPAGEDL